MSAPIPRTIVKQLSAKARFPAVRGKDHLAISWGKTQILIFAGEAMPLRDALVHVDKTHAMALLSPWIEPLCSELDFKAFEKALDWFCDEWIEYDEKYDIRPADFSKNMRGY